MKGKCILTPAGNVWKLKRAAKPVYRYEYRGGRLRRVRDQSSETVIATDRYGDPIVMVPSMFAPHGKFRLVSKLTPDQAALLRRVSA